MGLDNIREARTLLGALTAPARVELVLGDCPRCRDYDDARRNPDERCRREPRACYTHADDRSKCLSRFGPLILPVISAIVCIPHGDCSKRSLRRRKWR